MAAEPDRCFTVALADLTWLAKEWDALAARVEYCPQALALHILYGLVLAFLRGRGVRMGSWRGLRQHEVAMVAVGYQVVERVIQDEARDIWFPALTALGLANLEEVTAAFRRAAGRDVA